MIKYHVVAITDGEHERLDWTYDAEEAKAWVEDYKREDEEARKIGAPVGDYEYVIEEEDEEEGEGNEERELECGDYPDDRSVVVTGGRVKRFASSYAREMWEIGMRESDFCQSIEKEEIKFRPLVRTVSGTRASGLVFCPAGRGEHSFGQLPLTTPPLHHAKALKRRGGGGVLRVVRYDSRQGVCHSAQFEWRHFVQKVNGKFENCA